MVSNYYAAGTTTSRFRYSLGRATVKTVTTQAMTPLKAGAAVGVVSGGISAISNASKYKQGKITKRYAVLDTLAESAGLGLASGLGLLAGNVVRASLLLASTSPLIPFAFSVIVTASAKAMWDRNIKKRIESEKKQVSA